ncbi:MAG: hypothetical protein Kapaf2KO_00070 [Candidatus Kapaibacteriales bacterium]
MLRILTSTLLVAAMSALGSIGAPSATEIKYTVDQLDNGLKVIYNIDRSAPVVSCVLHYKVGSRDENPNLTGFAHFFEHLMFEATDDIERAKIPEYINAIGGNLNAHTSFDETVYKFTVPSNEIKLPLWIESSRMRRLKVESEGVETQRGVVKEERSNRYDNQPYGTMLEKMMQGLFLDGSYSWTTIGSPDHINNATIEEFQKFYDNFYQPNNATLVIAGDIDLEETKNYVRAYFGGFEKGPEPARSQFNLKKVNGEKRETIYDEKAQLPALFMGYHSPEIGSDDYYAMELLTTVMAAGESSRMYRELVDEQQIAVQTQFVPLALQFSGAAIIVGIPKPGKDINDLEESIDELIEEVAEKGITQKELEKVKNITIMQKAQSNRNVLEKAMALARYESYYGDPSLINTEIDKYLAVTKADIQRVAKKYFGEKNRVVLNYLPASMKEGK